MKNRKITGGRAPSNPQLSVEQGRQGEESRLRVLQGSTQTRWSSFESAEVKVVQEGPTFGDIKGTTEDPVDEQNNITGVPVVVGKQVPTDEQGPRNIGLGLSVTEGGVTDMGIGVQQAIDTTGTGQGMPQEEPRKKAHHGVQHRLITGKEIISMGRESDMLSGLDYVLRYYIEMASPHYHSNIPNLMPCSLKKVCCMFRITLSQSGPYNNSLLRFMLPSLRKTTEELMNTSEEGKIGGAHQDTKSREP